jgi:hypothetical protein
MIRLMIRHQHQCQQQQPQDHPRPRQPNRPQPILQQRNGNGVIYGNGHGGPRASHMMQFIDE